MLRGGNALRESILQVAHLDKQDSSLHSVKPPVRANDGVEVAYDAAVHADGFDLRCERVVVRKNGASVAIASKRLGREKRRGRGHDPWHWAARPHAVTRRAKGLGRILDDGHAKRPRRGGDRLEIWHLPEEAHCNDGLCHPGLDGGRNL